MRKELKEIKNNTNFSTNGSNKIVICKSEKLILEKIQDSLQKMWVSLSAGNLWQF